VLHQLNRIHHSHAGLAVLHEISKRVSHHGLKIVPYNDHTQDNAFAGPVNYQDATVKGGFERYNSNVKNSPYDIKAGKDVDDTGRLFLDAKGQAIRGTGKGTDSIIKYSPSTW